MKKVIIIIVCLLMLSSFTGCTTKKENVTGKPIVLKLWHAYNVYVKKEFDDLITEFNNTVGLEKGILIEAYGYGSTDELKEALLNSANRLIGSEILPDIFLAYPDFACSFAQLVTLTDLKEYFTAEELEQYQKAFLEEGQWGDADSLYMLPVSKSTELLYVNKTEFDLFAKETGVSEEMLSTWEGLTELSETYFNWSGGQPFLGMNSYDNFSVMSAVQQGVELYPKNGSGFTFQYPQECAKKVWDVYYVPHINGWYKSGTYNQDGIKNGTMLAYIGSSAGANYFPEEVVLNETERYPIDCLVLPYPSFKDGIKYMPQRGANMSVISSSKQREYAASVFLKWFTEPEQNMKFSVSTGYLPVKKEALASTELLTDFVSEKSNKTVKKAIEVSLKAMNEGKFYIEKPNKRAYEANDIFSNSLANKIKYDLKEISLMTANDESRDKLVEEYIGSKGFLEWHNRLVREMAGIIS